MQGYAAEIFLSNQNWKFKKSMEFVSISGWGTDRTYQNDFIIYFHFEKW